MADLVLAYDVPVAVIAVCLYALRIQLVFLLQFQVVYVTGRRVQDESASYCEIGVVERQFGIHCFYDSTVPQVNLRQAAHAVEYVRVLSDYGVTVCALEAPGHNSFSIVDTL